jgi:hypothetical protein
MLQSLIMLTQLRLMFQLLLGLKDSLPKFRGIGFWYQRINAAFTVTVRDYAKKQRKFFCLKQNIFCKGYLLRSIHLYKKIEI